MDTGRVVSLSDGRCLAPTAVHGALFAIRDCGSAPMFQLKGQIRTRGAGSVRSSPSGRVPRARTLPRYRLNEKVVALAGPSRSSRTVFRPTEG